MAYVHVEGDYENVFGYNIGRNTGKELMRGVHYYGFYILQDAKKDIKTGGRKH